MVFNLNDSPTSTMNVFNLVYIREVTQETKFALNILPKWHLWSPNPHSSVVTIFDSKLYIVSSMLRLSCPLELRKVIWRNACAFSSYTKTLSDQLNSKVT